MRKLYKALVLILALLLMTTAFAVVSFAQEATPYSLAKAYSLKANNFDSDSYTEASVFGYSGKNADGRLRIQHDGNKYVAMQYNGASGSSGQWDIDFGSSTKYNVLDYPCFVFEFDTMTEGSTFSDASLYPRLGTSGLLGFVKEVKFSALNLSTASYEWQHVSIVVKYNGDKTFSMYGYVNGVKQADIGDYTFTGTDSDLQTLRVNQIRFYPTATDAVGLDNLSFTYFPAGYANGDVDAIANYNYKSGEGYEFPFGRVLATVTDNKTGEVTYYDNYEEAYAAKNDGNTFESKFAAEIIDANGKASYVTDADFATKFNSLPHGATIKLHKDVTVDAQLTFTASTTTTLDLNGYKMYRLGRTYTDYAAVLNEQTGKYEKGEALESPAAIAGGSLFYLGKGSTTFNVTSSRPGAEIYSVSITADRLLLDGKVVSSTVTKTSSSNIFYLCTQKNVINIDGKNITFYANSIVNGEHGGGTNCTINVDGGFYVKIHSSTNALFHLIYGGNITLKNATLVASNYIFRHDKSSCSAVIDNCNFLGGNVTFGENTTSVGTYTITNSRLSTSVDKAYGNVTVGERTRLGSDYSKLANAESNSRIQNVKTISYTLPKKTISVDPITLVPYVETEKLTYTFNYLVLDPSTALATVTYKDWEGNVIKTLSLEKEEFYAPPTFAIPTGDGYTGYGVSKWLDKDGNVFDNVITSASEQVYTAVRPTEDDELVAWITDARMSFSYVAQFHMYFYLPVKDDMARPALTGQVPSASSGSALIGGQKYYVYTWWCSAPTVSENTNFTVNFEIDGKTYNQSFSINALLYAQIILSDPASDEEAASVANMVRYVKEARLVAGKSVGDEFDALIGPEGLYPNLADYPEAYPDDSLNTSAIADYIDWFTLSISGTPKYSLRLSQNAIDLGMTRANFKLVTKDGKLLELFDYAKNGKDYETNNTKIYDLAKTFTITVTVPATEENESFTVSCDYSIGTYIKGVTAQNPDANVDLAKATYCFALAVQAYRNSVIDY